MVRQMLREGWELSVTGLWWLLVDLLEGPILLEGSDATPTSLSKPNRDNETGDHQ